MSLLAFKFILIWSAQNMNIVNYYHWLTSEAHAYVQYVAF